MKQFDSQYIAALERQNRLLRMIVLLGTLILGAMATIGWQSGAQSLTVRSLKVVDDSGKEMILIGSNKGGGAIHVKGSAGMDLVAISSTEQFGDGVINVMDSKGVRRLVAGFLKASTESNREAGFGTYDPEGKIRVILGQNHFNNYGLTVKGTQATQLEAGVKNDQSYIHLCSIIGRLKSRWVEDGESTIEFYNPTNLPILSIGGAGRNISRIPNSNGNGFRPTQTWPPNP